MKVLILFAVAVVAVAATPAFAQTQQVISVDTTWTSADSPQNRFWMEGDSTLTIPTGETVVISSPDPFPTSYTDNAGGGSNTVDVSGTLDFSIGHAFGAGDFPDDPDSVGTINIQSTGVLNTADFRLGVRAEALVNIWGELNINKANSSYNAGFAMFGGLTANGGQSTVNQYAGSSVSVDGLASTSGRFLDLDANTSWTAGPGNTYNMLGGTLALDDIVNTNGDGVFNYEAGTITIRGQDRTNILAEPWFNDLGTNTMANFNGLDTVITSDGVARNVWDANNDTFVTTADLQIILDNYFMEGNLTIDDGDGNFDDVIDHNDYLGWKAEFLSGSGSLAEIEAFFASSQVPEPTSVAILALGSVVMLGLVRRRK